MLYICKSSIDVLDENDRQVDLVLVPGALPKNTRRVCAATLTPIFKPPVTE